MDYKEFVIEWNNVMQMKIKESDLRIPNETILTNILLHYLEQFGFSINLLRECQINENTAVRHKFKVKLCAYINHLYKLANETSQPFSYFDLINPQPKKTRHVLKYLLNYLLFFNMMKMDVIVPTTNKIHEYKEMCSKVNAEETKEKNKEKLKAKYHKEIPKLIDEIEHLNAIQHDQIKKIEELRIKLEENETHLIKLNDQKSQLSSKVVSNEEADLIAIKKTALEKELDEQSEIEHAVMDRNRQTKIALNKLEELVKYGNNIMEIYSLNDFEKYCLIVKKQQDLYSTENLLKNKNEQTKIVIEQYLVQINNKKEIFKEEVEKLKNIEIEGSRKIHELEKNIEEEENINELIDLELHNIENSLQTEQNNENTIESAKKFLLKPLKDKPIFGLNFN